MFYLNLVKINAYICTGKSNNERISKLLRVSNIYICKYKRGTML